MINAFVTWPLRPGRPARDRSPEPVSGTGQGPEPCAPRTVPPTGVIARRPAPGSLYRTAT
ncbi:hypothetical protein GCM10023082_33670 [Streptomyces tremellae]|uniref:Uncharacterized protein n=1 Tax=Streptomyces tremellae TaxID=1124239 RepID=A0ABP7F8Q7_9ACTN